MYPLFSLWLGVFLSSLRNPSLLQSHEEVFQEFLLYDMFCFYTWVFHYVAIYFCICLRWGSNLIFIFHGINQLVWPHVLMIQCLPLIWGSLFYIYIPQGHFLGSKHWPSRPSSLPILITKGLSTVSEADRGSSPMLFFFKNYLPFIIMNIIISLSNSTEYHTRIFVRILLGRLAPFKKFGFPIYECEIVLLLCLSIHFIIFFKDHFCFSYQLIPFPQSFLFWFFLKLRRNWKNGVLCILI